MQKIIIKNFGAIEYAEIEIKKVLVLIGEQASGKSTIAKLIYFFKSLKDYLLSKYQLKTSDSLDIVSNFIFLIQERFYDFFGSTLYIPIFEITYYYSLEKNKFINLVLDDEKRINASLSDNFFNENIEKSINQIKKLLEDDLSDEDLNSYAPNIGIIRYIQRLSTILSQSLESVFETSQTDLFFVIASRNVTVSYSNQFNMRLFAGIQNTLENNNQKSSNNKQQITDDILMIEFIEKCEIIKNIFEKFDNFDGLINRYVEDEAKKHHLINIMKKVYKILRGRYCIDSDGEKIVLDSQSKKYVYLHNASSGQKESIRILQDIFLNIINDRIILRIIEEPEAHLFPIAQKDLIELLAVMVNQNHDNQIIITTHSPYILSVFNNLLFAKRVVEKNPSTHSEVAEIISEDYWLNGYEFSAYSLGNRSWNGEANYCESIFDSEMGLIAQNYLDTVSEMMGGEFNQLYNIHARTFKRK
jgi:predicted ATP-dependent endonuclease of OLD family